MELKLYIFLFFLGTLIGSIIGFLFKGKRSEKKISSAKSLSQKILEETKKEAERIKKEAEIQAKDSIIQAKTEFGKESRERKQDIQKMEKRLLQKEENVDRKVDLLDRKELDLSKKEKLFTQKEKELEEKQITYNQMIGKQRMELEKISGISSEDAKKELLSLMEEEAKHEAAKMIKRIEDEAREEADKKAKEILAFAIERYAGDYVVEKTTTIISLPSDDMKGRIIGREGRNIRALEAATGVELIVDDTPESVILSGYNPIRREIARISLERLISDGRIHPSRIEEVVEVVEQEVELAVREAGEQAVFDVNVHGIHSELIKLIGKLKYRTSYSQNMLQHSIEVAFLCGTMAGELGLNIKQAKRAGLLHDIGKALDHEKEGSHAFLGAELAKKYEESKKIINAIAAHHGEEKPESVLAILVAAADSISAARPGARKEMFETYIKRLEDLERIANSFSGVNKTYAIQAGREVRVIVESSKVNDEDSVILCRDIAKKIEKELSYSGQIKITVIRETRAVDYAK